jgi:hypothetical protein
MPRGTPLRHPTTPIPGVAYHLKTRQDKTNFIKEHSQRHDIMCTQCEESTLYTVNTNIHRHSHTDIQSVVLVNFPVNSSMVKLLTTSGGREFHNFTIVGMAACFVLAR